MSALTERLSRRRGDAAPDDPAAVVLVALARPVTRAMIVRALEAAEGGVIAVVTTLRIHGSAWGMPNPGLLPNANEKAEALRLVEATVGAIERRGGRADGQITATRHPARVVAAAARRRRARLVLIEAAPVGRVRAVVEGDLAGSVRRRVGAQATVEVVERPTAPVGRPGGTARRRGA